MEDSDKNRILRQLDFLCVNTKNHLRLTTILVSKGIFSTTECQEVMNRSTEYEKSYHFYELVVKKGVTAFGALIKALDKSGNSYVVQRLMRGLSSTSSVESESPDAYCGLHWFGCQPHDPNFTGRAQELETLKKISNSLHWKLSKEPKTMKPKTPINYVVISGDEGVGKSELVRYFVQNQFQEPLTGHCLWLDCESLSSALESYKKLAAQLDVMPTMPEKFLEAYVKLFLSHFQSEKYVTVLDNVVDYAGPMQTFVETLGMQRPGFKKPFVIITSRNKRLLPQESTSIEIQDLSVEEGREYLIKSLALTNIDMTTEVLDRVTKFLSYNILKLKTFVNSVKDEDRILMDTQNRHLCLKVYVESLVNHP